MGKICSSYEGQRHRDGICQNCGFSKEAHGPASDRLKPTDDDCAILQRNMRRLFRWDNEIHGVPLSASRAVISQSNLLPTIRRACDDYLHFKPS